MDVVPPPLPPAHIPTQHQDFLDFLAVYGLVPKPEWWIPDPMHEKGSKKMIGNHMETLYNKANKDMWNQQTMHWSCNIQVANAS